MMANLTYETLTLVTGKWEFNADLEIGGSGSGTRR